MPMLRTLTIPCPSCGQVGRYSLEPTEYTPQVILVWCDSEEGGCGVPFAVEVRMQVEIEYSTCRLTLPSTTRRDCLEETEIPYAPDPNDF